MRIGSKSLPDHGQHHDPAAFATPVLFAFSPGTQLEMVVGSHESWPRKELATTRRHAEVLVEEVRRTRTPTGMAVGTPSVESCLVALPVKELERASGRGGLCVILGMAMSAGRIADVPMCTRIVVALERALRVACWPRSSTGTQDAANELTRVLQSGTDRTVRREIIRLCEKQSRCFTELATGGATTGRVPDAGSPGHVVVLCEMLLTQLRQHGRNQLGCYVRLDSVDGDPITAPGENTECRFTDDGLFLCRSADLLTC